MLGVYYRRSTRAPWLFLGRAKSVIGAELKMRAKARAERVGVLLFVDASNFLDTVPSLRMLGDATRVLARRGVRALLRRIETAPRGKDKRVIR